MHTIAKLAAGLTTAALTVATSPMASADPVIPLDPVQLPGLAAVQNLSPVVQQAATDPASAQELLLAAASQLAGNATTPGGSTALAEAVTRFVQHGGAAMGPAAPPASAAVTQQAATGMPHGTAPLLTPGPGNGPIPLQQHVPAAGVVPGAEAHLPTGINPAHAAGPVPEAMPEVPTAVAAPSPAPAPGSAPAAAEALAYDPNTPPTQDFLYPSMSNGCLKDGGNVIATAISVAGPAAIPTPGPGAGQTAYVFTAVGTPAMIFTHTS